MDLARPDNVKHYAIGLSVAADMFNGGGCKNPKSRAPKPADAKRIKDEFGMDWVEASAGALAMAMFSVPNREALEAWGHGADPIDYEAFRVRRKLGQKTYLDYLGRAGDAVPLRNQLKKAARQLQREGFMTASATLVTFVDELAECTIDQGAPGLFIDYFAEHMEELRSKFLVKDKPLDEAILRRKVLCRRNHGEDVGTSPTTTPRTGGTGACATTSDRNLAQSVQVAELLKDQERLRSQLATLTDRFTKMKEETTVTRPNEKNKCFECGSTEHFGYNCPIRKKRLEEESKKSDEEAKKKDA